MAEGRGRIEGRIFRQDEKDNFWQMGETGPCGPCSELHYDLGPEASDLPAEDDHFPSESGRYVEIWNLVFMQFDRDTNGKLEPLPRPSIDTGMGLERITAVMQDKLSNYDTDLICPIIHRAADLFRVGFGEDPKVDTALRIVADHSRATEFLIHDGVLPRTMAAAMCCARSCAAPCGTPAASVSRIRSSTGSRVSWPN